LDITTSPVTGLLIDTVTSEKRSYLHELQSREPLIYTITAVDIYGNESLLSGDFHKAMNLNISYDSCKSSMFLEWGNYIGWKNSLSGYKIYARNGEDEEFELQAILDSADLSYTHQDIQENNEYEYYVEAFNNQSLRSFSNMQKYYTFMPEGPSFLSLDYVSVIDNERVEMAFSADISGEINDFELSKASSPAGEFQLVESFNDLSQSTVHYTDFIATQAQIYYYKVSAINSCGKAVSTSNVSNNIIVRGEVIGADIHLSWSDYATLGNGVAEYSVCRESEFDEFETIATLSASSTSFTDRYTDLAERVSGDTARMGKFTYMVIAKGQDNNQLGVSTPGKSNKVTVDVETRIFLPNAFTPDGNGNNDYFLPVLDFAPRDFRMFIYDRTGKVLFQTNNHIQGWDGRINGRGKALEGVYVYHIEYLSYNGVRQVRTGNLTLIYP